MPDEQPPAPEPAPDGRVTLASKHVAKQIRDALELSAFAIESGARAADDDLPFDTITTIQTTAARAGILSSPDEPWRTGTATDGEGEERAPEPAGALTAKEWNDFGLAYYRLAVAMSPVTAETLRDTEGTSRDVSTWSGDRTSFAATLRKIGYFALGFSPAQRFARGLWLVAIAFALFVVVAEWLSFNLGQETEVSADIKSKKQIVESLIPWAYGGLGACAYLLRCAHTFIYNRCFDLRRKSEYFNRILLGAISGGTIVLFTKYLVNDEGVGVELGSAALGFIAGYSTDFLFNTIERIVTAIFPKTSDAEAAAKPARTPSKPTKPRSTNGQDGNNQDGSGNGAGSQGSGSGTTRSGTG